MVLKQNVPRAVCNNCPNFCFLFTSLKRTKASAHRSKSSKADDEDDNRNWSDYSDSEEEKREISTFYMYVDPGDGITQDLNGNLKTIEANI